MTRTHLLLLGLCLAMTACSARNGNFSQYPGFSEWYAANPPSVAMPDEAEQALLARYQPRLFVARDSGRPIRFYEDYIAHGELRDRDGKLISEQVDRQLLNQYANDPSVVFSHRPTRPKQDAETAAGLIARIDHASLPAVDAFAKRPLIFLTYHYVFAYSGVAAGIRSWQRFFIDLFASTTDWHQLDHYTAVSIVLDADSQQPLAVMLQQHNYLRTWLLSNEAGPGRTPLPPDRRVQIVAARDSNELFLRRDELAFRRAVPMLTPENVRWLVMGQDRPWITADDVTDPAIEVPAKLTFLPASDAFYTFKGWLGERRITPGRDGPPGADFNTLPALMPRAHQLAFSWWHEDDEQYVQLVESVVDRDKINLGPFWRRLHQSLPAPQQPRPNHTQDLTVTTPSFSQPKHAHDGPPRRG